MSSLKEFLETKGYHRIKLKTTATQHLEVVAKINNVEGFFLVDTGASSSCIDIDAIEHFGLTAEESEVKAAGAGAVNMLTQLAQKNTIQIKNWKKRRVDFVLFDLRHVNEALTSHKAQKVHGIIGADLLKKGKAVIDYKKGHLFLK